MTTYDAGNPGTGFEQAKKCGRVKHVLIILIGIRQLFSTFQGPGWLNELGRWI